jgi:hypothetical protein
MNGYASGTEIRENCAFIQSNGSAWMYPQQTVIVANSSSSVFNSVTSGMAGLGTTVNGSFNSSIFGMWFERYPTQPNFTFGLQLDAPRAVSSTNSILHWGAADENSYTGTVTTKNVVSPNANATLDSDWLVELDGWSFQSGGVTVSNTSSNLQVIADPFYADLFVPLEAANLIYAAVEGAQPSSSQDGTTTAWQVPCGTQMTFTPTFGSLPVILDQSILVIDEGNNVCVGSIQGFSNASVNEYVFGSTFISQIYMSVQFGAVSSWRYTDHISLVGYST